MPNTIVFANKQLFLQKQKLAALKAVALKKQKLAAAATATALKKQKLAAAAALKKQKLAATAALKATALQKQYKKPNPTPIILSVASDYVSVPGVVFNQNIIPDLNKINISVSSVYVPAI
jgi:hypothetical protein